MKKEKLLFKCETENNYEQYLIMKKELPKDYITFILFDILFLLVLSIIFVINKQGIGKMLYLYILLSLIFLAFFAIIIKKSKESVYEKNYKFMEGIYPYAFYETFFTFLGYKCEYKIYYDRIKRIKVKENNFYLYMDSGICFRLQKDKMDEGLDDFLNNKFKNKIQKDKKSKKEIFMNLFSIATIIINILLFFSFDDKKALFSDELRYFPFKTLGLLSIAIYVIFPLISIIFAAINRKLYKNFIIPIIVAVSVIIWYFYITFFPLLLPNNKSVQNINNYIEKTRISIPNNITYSEVYPYYKSDKEFKIKRKMEIVFKYDDSKEFYNNMNNNNLFIQYPKTKSTIRYLLPNNCLDNDYVLIYDNTLNDYNRVPNGTGEYNYYVYVFNKVHKTLTIYDIIVNYNK